MKRLAIIASHPIQYYAPWFHHLAAQLNLELKVFYLWDFGIESHRDQKFDRTFQWDIPLLEGYNYDFIPNLSSQPGTHHFRGLNNPQLLSRLLEWKPDAAFFTTLFYLSPLKTLLSLRLRSVPCLFRGDSHLLGRRQGPALAPLNQLKRFIFKSFSACLHVGQANRAYFNAHGVPDSKLFASPHCIDNARFSHLHPQQESWLQEERTRLGLDRARLVFLFVGKFEAKKRPVLLAELFNSLPDDDIRLIFVGDGFLKPDLKAIAQVDSRVHILPFQNQSIMPAVYRLGHCLILPSYGPGETWGLCVNEAMASGLPAIVSSHVGCGSDLIEQGKTGWVFDADQPEQLKHTLQTIVKNPDTLKEASANARRHIQNFSYEQASEGLLKALNSIT